MQPTLKAILKDALLPVSFWEFLTLALSGGIMMQARHLCCQQGSLLLGPGQSCAPSTGSNVPEAHGNDKYAVWLLPDRGQLL